MIGFSERHIRLCNGEWELCDGDCEYCQKASIVTTTTTTAEYKVDYNGKVVKIDNDISHKTQEGKNRKANCGDMV